MKFYSAYYWTYFYVYVKFQNYTTSLPRDIEATKRENFYPDDGIF